jgi:hypothetical protein
MPHLPAVYVEDLVDACEQLGIYAIRSSTFMSGDSGQYPVTEVNTAHAGMGLGLCDDWRPDVPCTGRIPPIENGGPNILNLLFTDHAIAAYVSPLGGASSEFYSVGSSNFSLGLSAQTTFKTTDIYWHHVQGFINGVLNSIYRGSCLDAAVLHGEHAENDMLRQALVSALEGRKQPQFYIRNPLFAAARGAAELTDRCMHLADIQNWHTCIPDLRPQMQGW